MYSMARGDDESATLVGPKSSSVPAGSLYQHEDEDAGYSYGTMENTIGRASNVPPAPVHSRGGKNNFIDL